MKPRRTLGASRNQCPGCDEYFNSNTAFEKHRIGRFGIDRRCATPDEMRGMGMSLNSEDWWITEVYDPDKVQRLNV